MSASVLVSAARYGTIYVKSSKSSRICALLVATALTLVSTESARAQSAGPLQQWAGTNNGAVAGFDTPQQACESNQYTYIPAFGHEVNGLLSVTQAPDTMNPYTGVKVPAYDCRYDSGQYGQDTIRSLLGCTDGNKLVNGACLPASYPVTAEPVCDAGCKGIPGQYPAVGDPVSLSTGAKFEEITDYTSGGPYPIEIKRYYRSLNMPRDADSIGFGLAWRVDLVGRKSRTDSSGYNFVISRQDGAQSRFMNTDNVSYGIDWNQYSIEGFLYNGSISYGGENPKESRDRFRQIDGLTYEYQDEHDRIDVFQAQFGNPIGVVKTRWKGGYERNYVYAADDYGYDRPIQINDSFGRTVNITWNGNLISEISLPDGTRLQYSYEARVVNGNVPSAMVLTQVTRRRADGTLIDVKGYQYAPPQSGTQVPLLVGVTDTAGATIDSTTYDAIGRVLTAQGPNGANAVNIAYDDQAGTRTVTNSLGQVQVYTFAKSGIFYPGTPDTSLLRMTSVARQQSATVPAASMSLTYSFGEYTKTDWNGLVTKLTYDSRQNETQRIEDFNGLQRTTTTVWSPTLRLPTQIVAPNLTVDMTYDTSGRLTQRKETDTSVRNGPVRIWNYTYNTLGLLATVTGPRTDVTQTTTYTYDTQGNLATVKDALNRVTTITAVNAAGLPTSITDQNGVVTNMAYDPLGRVTSTAVQGSVPATTSFVYDVNGLLTSVTSPSGVTLTYGYDAAHRLTSITDAAGNKTVFALDGLSNRTQTQIQTGSAQVLMANSATFDSLGRLLTSIGAANQTTSYQYDNNGNLTRLTDPRNAVTQNAFDGLNRLKQTTDALNAVTATAYNLQDNVTSVTDPKLHATTYTVNAFGFVTQIVSPDSGTTIYTYDLAGNVLSRKDARKIVTNYTYDALNRPLTRTYPSNTAENVTFGYDATANGNYGVGRLTSLTDSAGTASFVYDAYGNRISEKRTISSVVYTTGYAHDLAGKITKVTYPSGFIVNYQRDSLGQVSGVTTQANSGATAVAIATNIAYLPFGPMQAMTLGNGVQVTNSYDLDYRLSRRQAIGAATVQDLTLSYDGASNITGITDAVGANLSQTFQYDLMGRVTQGAGVYGTDNYTYDAIGNRMTRSLVNGGTTLTTYTYATANTQLTKAVTGSSTLNYTYDANGALITRKLGNTTQASYTYNANARLATSGTAALKYNAFGERSVETITGGGTHFLFAEDGALLAEHTVQGALVRNYVYLNGQPFATVDAAGTVSYILNDQVGQPQKMLNASGAVSWHRVAGIFGDTVSQAVGTTAANPQRFPGQQFDPNLALHYNYFRDYDPATGRYLETDPIGLNGGINLYQYALSNPVRYTDPQGKIVPLALCLLGGAVSGGVTAIGDYIGTGKISAGHVVVAAGVGCVAGAAAPFATTLARTALLGAASNTAQYAITNYIDCEEVTPEGLVGSAVTGGLSGQIGGRFKKPPYVWDTPDKAFNKVMNDSNALSLNVTATSVLRNIAATVSSYLSGE
jgi:RHS repeat-associated protein